MAIKPLTKIIVVDDDDDILTIAKCCLQSLKNVEVVYVSSGEAAIREAIQFQPDLILLDVMMPKMDGMATLNAIRQIQAIAHIPIVFFTAKVQKEEIFSYLQVGVIGVIIKPFDPITLGAKLQAIWDKYQGAPNG